MNTMLWAFQIILTLAFGAFGLQKVYVPIPDLIAQGMLWIADFPEWQVRLIGLLEVLGVVGLNAPYLVKAVPKRIIPLAAGGLALTMIGAIATHIERGDPALSVIITSVLFAMSATIAVKQRQQLDNRR